MSESIKDCPQPETPIRERAWTDEQITAMTARAVDSFNRSVNARNHDFDLNECGNEDLTWLLRRALIAAIGASRPSVPEQVRYAIVRCLASQEALVTNIDALNPGDPYASLLVQEDIETVRDWLAGVTDATHPKSARSGVVSDEDVRDAARYRWLLDQYNSEGRGWHVRLPNNGVPDLLNEAIDAAIQGERHER